MNGLERRIALLCAAAGVFLLIVGTSIFLVEQRMSNAVSYSLIAGVALLISYAILDPGALVAAVRSRQLRFGSLSVLVSAAFLAILVVGNLLAARGTQSWGPHQRASLHALTKVAGGGSPPRRRPPHHRLLPALGGDRPGHPGAAAGAVPGRIAACEGEV